MRAWHPDVVHTWHDASLCMAATVAAQLAIPLVHRIYNVPSVQEAFEPHAPAGHAHMVRALGAATHVVALSATAADDVAAFYGIERPEVIHNGFPLGGRRYRGRTPVGKRTGRFVLLAVGRFSAEKGHASLIDAMRVVARTHAHVDLWLAGVGPLESELRRQVLNDGLTDRARFLGFREDVSDLLAAADLFVFPSLTEGFGNALGEALVAGLPIVASDLPVIRNEILADAPAARLYPAGNSVALAEAIDALVRDGAARTALKAQARIAGARFRVDRMLERYRAMYARLAARRRAAA
jgi:glycosyltransferase involved in cell wall biosynthesis